MSPTENVVYLELRDVLKIHGAVFNISDEQAQDHLRNVEGLHSVLARPKQYAHYEEADLALQAAVVSHGIAEGQLFVDGNKRTAAMCLTVFLRMNGFVLSSSKRALADWVLELSRGATAEQLADHLRDVMVEIE